MCFESEAGKLLKPPAASDLEGDVAHQEGTIPAGFHRPVIPVSPALPFVSVVVGLDLTR